MSGMVLGNPSPGRVDHDAASALPTRFAFGGAAGEVLREYFQRDVQQARLSTKFKWYYGVRPYIPIRLRQLLQAQRNRKIQVPAGWYLSTQFVAEFQAALESEPHAVAIHPWPDGQQMSAVLTHDVETSIGVGLVDRLAALEEKHGLRSAWHFIPYKYQVDRGLLADLKRRGHEIGVHGYNHDGRLFESRKRFDSRTGPINQAIENYGCQGFRAPMVHRHLAWMQALNIGYDSSCFDVDPFQAMPGGVGGVWPFFAGKFVELPYTLPQDHTLLVSLGETTPRVWIEKFVWLRSLAGMALLITHPDYLNTPSRLDVYRQFLEYLSAQRDVWYALPKEVVAWWRLRDNLQIVERNGSPQVVGPFAERARIFSPRELPLGRNHKET